MVAAEAAAAAGDTPGSGDLCRSSGSESERSGHGGDEATAVVLICFSKPAQYIGRWTPQIL